MNTLRTWHIMDIMSIVIDTVEENESYFCDLDSAAGDGDFGTSLANGFRGIRSDWDSLDKEEIGGFMKSCGLIIMEKCGGASGPIWGTAFRHAGSYAKGKDSIDLEGLAGFFQALVDGVQKIGGAKPGDKTLLDALIPAAESLKQSASAQKDFSTAVKECAEAAGKGAETTKEIPAAKGRARYLGDRSVGYYDAGAKAVAVILADVYDKYFKDRDFSQ